jgi:hypothetical protein
MKATLTKGIDYDDFGEWHKDAYEALIKKLEVTNFLFIEATFNLMHPRKKMHHRVLLDFECTIYDSIIYKKSLDKKRDLLSETKYIASPIREYSVGNMFKYSSCPAKNQKKECPCPRCIESRTGDVMWMCDSGASDHFTFSLNDYSEYTPFAKDDIHMVKTADSISQLLGEGTAVFHHKLSTGKSHLVKLFPVLYMPTASSHLISNGRLCKQGLLALQDDEQVVFSFKDSGRKYLEGIGIYAWDTLTWASVMVTFVSSCFHSMSLTQVT